MALQQISSASTLSGAIPSSAVISYESKDFEGISQEEIPRNWKLNMLQVYPHLLWLSLHHLKPVVANHISDYWRMVGMDWDGFPLFSLEELFLESSQSWWICHTLLNSVPSPNAGNESPLPAVGWFRCPGCGAPVGQLPPSQKRVRHTGYHGLTCTSVAFLMVAAASRSLCHLFLSHGMGLFTLQPLPATSPAQGVPQQHRAVLCKPAQGTWSSALQIKPNSQEQCPEQFVTKQVWLLWRTLKDQYAQIQELVPVPLLSVPVAYDVFVTL